MRIDIVLIVLCVIIVSIMQLSTIQSKNHGTIKINSSPPPKPNTNKKNNLSSVMYDDNFQQIRDEAIIFMKNKEKTFLTNWCKEAELDTPVGYNRYNNEIIIYTDKPMYLGG